MQTTVTRQDLIDFVVHECRLLDAKRYEEWNALFTDDAFYWLPLVPDQEDGYQHTSHMYEDKLLRDLRIERRKARAPSRSSRPAAVITCCRRRPSKPSTRPATSS